MRPGAGRHQPPHRHSHRFLRPGRQHLRHADVPYRWAPTGLATRRQLRARGLRPGGQPITAQIIWKHKGKRRVAYLYRTDLAKAKRTATAAQLAAIQSALRARRTCRTCGHEHDYYIPRSRGECNDCTERQQP